MNRQTANFAPSRPALTTHLEDAYLELKRLRELVKLAERRQHVRRVNNDRKQRQGKPSRKLEQAV